MPKLLHIRKPVLRDTHAEIPLSRGLHALVDIEDVPLVGEQNWYANPNLNTFYAVRNQYNEAPRKLRMHHLMLPPKQGFVVDHINQNGLDNRRRNLRYATHGQNIANGTHSRRRFGRLKGAFKLPTGRWRASITYQGATKHLGVFDTEEEAHAAYAEVAKQVHGTFTNVR